MDAAAKQKLFFNNWELFGESSKQKRKKKVTWQGERFIDKHVFVMGKEDREGKAYSLKKIEYCLGTIK